MPKHIHILPNVTDSFSPAPGEEGFKEGSSHKITAQLYAGMHT